MSKIIDKILEWIIYESSNLEERIEKLEYDFGKLEHKVSKCKKDQEAIIEILEAHEGMLLKIKELLLNAEVVVFRPDYNNDTHLN